MLTTGFSGIIMLTMASTGILMLRMGILAGKTSAHLLHGYRFWHPDFHLTILRVTNLATGQGWHSR